MHGVEITGFGIGGLLSVRKSYALMHNFLTTQRQHGWAMTLEQALSVFRHVRKVDTVQQTVNGRVSLFPRVNARCHRNYAYLFSIFWYLQELQPKLKAGEPLPFSPCSNLILLLEQNGAAHMMGPLGKGPSAPPSTGRELNALKVKTFYGISCRQVLESDILRYQSMARDVINNLCQWLKTGGVDDTENHLVSSVYA